MKSKFIFPAAALLAFGLTVVLSSCLKKGEDDPLVSLRTRNKRLIGKWDVSYGFESHYNSQGEPIYYAEYKNDSIYSIVQSMTNNPIPLRKERSSL
jgi:hypothetical protein